MVTIPVKGRVKRDGTLDLHVSTGLPETDVDVLLVLEPVAPKLDQAVTIEGAWPGEYFETTFGSLRDNPLAQEPPPALESRQELR